MIEKRMSVRGLAEFASHTGDIDARLVASVKPIEGARLHRMLQQNAGDDYVSEIHLKTTLAVEDVKFTVSGRADGIIINDSGVTIDEIKTTLRNLDFIEADTNPAHWSQAKCYAHIYAETFGAEEITVRLTYYHALTGQIKRFAQKYTAEELASHFVSLLLKCVRWARLEHEWNEISRATMTALPFPFESFRDGQRRFAGAVYRAVRDGFDLFAAAPTGTGKTVSALYPAIRALGEGLAEKIFYMTAKETGRQTACDAIAAMENAGLRVKTALVTARDRICPLEHRACYPEKCDRALGHYDRVGDAVFQSLRDYDFFDRDRVSELAEAYNICPFEFSLDLAEYADVIVCDYNYAFDPKAYLRRFFQETENKYVFLADESHNLPERAREMYSCELPRSVIALARKTAPKHRKLRSALSKLDKFLQSLKTDEPGDFELENRPDGLDALVAAVDSAVTTALLDGAELSPEMLDAFWLTLDYERVVERFDEDYAVILRSGDRDVSVKLYCCAPAKELREKLIPSRAAVFFSATLSPPDYYRVTLGARDEARALALPSPFPRENFLPVIAGTISTRYRDRAASMNTVADMIAVTARAKRGNYIAFFPSYEYLRTVYAAFSTRYPDVTAYCQESKMGDRERLAFLERFDAEDGFVAFCVQGGLFAEGVDLRGERVVGVVIVGAGLPGIGAETELLREKFGFDYAYTFPGFNRVLQAAGRLIRTETDRGAAVLIDDRFMRTPYPPLFPEHWSHRKFVRDADELDALLREFWERDIT